MIPGAGGYDTLFRLYDTFGNQVDNLLVNKDMWNLGTINYTFTRLDTGIVARYGPLPMWNSSGFFRLDIDNMPKGVYRLAIGTPTQDQIWTDVNFISSTSLKLSPTFSYALRDNNRTAVLVNSLINIRFYARNVHNQTIDSFSDASIVNAL